MKALIFTNRQARFFCELTQLRSGNQHPIMMPAISLSTASVATKLAVMDMHRTVFCCRSAANKIADAIVLPISIYVMHLLRALKRSSKVDFHNCTMFIHVGRSFRKWMQRCQHLNVASGCYKSACLKIWMLFARHLFVAAGYTSWGLPIVGFENRFRAVATLGSWMAHASGHSRVCYVQQG